MRLRKVVIKEFERTFIGIDIMLYSIYTVFGYLLLGFPEVELLSPIEYLPVLFFTFGFFSLLAYFLNRRIDNYEYLFFGLINVIVASYIMIVSYVGNDAFVVCSSIVLYSVMCAFNKFFRVYTLTRNKDVNFYPKMISTILIIMLGSLMVDPLVTKYVAVSIILGYYFIGFGLINLLELFFTILIRNPKLDKKLSIICGLESKKVKTKKILKEVKPKKLKKITKD